MTFFFLKKSYIKKATENMKKPINIARNHEIIKHIRTFKKQYRPSNQYFVEDLSVLDGLNIQNVHILAFLYVENRVYKDQAQRVIDKLNPYATNTYIISEKTAVLIQEKDNAVGLFALIEPKNATLPSLRNSHFLVVLDGMENPGNVGSIIRTCDAVCVDGILHVDSRVNINHPTIVASSRGMNFEIASASMTYQQASVWLKENGFTVYVGEPIVGKSIEDVQYREKIAIVVGSERFGVNTKWFEESHVPIHIPMYGKMKSLNVAIATGIVLYDVALKSKREK